MTLDLWFRPSDYYTFLATNMSLKDPALQERYLSDVDWPEAVPYFSHSFGVSFAVVTSDGYPVFTQRGKNIGTRPRVYDTSVIEGLSRPLDRGRPGKRPMSIAKHVAVLLRNWDCMNRWILLLLILLS
ncbi:MAG TPA: hypothetical protein VED37_09095 [Ktedonobacteraceae bacterium]|nr:hypothetical protein [Ktedonobacteraceae bacterium]